MLTPASTADDPTRDIALAKSSELTAKAASTFAILLITSVEESPSLLKELTAAVKDFTESAACIPVRRVRIKASFVRTKVCSMPKPCRANSVVASATVSKL